MRVNGIRVVRVKVENGVLFFRKRVDCTYRVVSR